MTGLVIKSTGSHYAVLCGDEVFTCRIRGSFRIKGIDATNPVVVGDRVEADLPAGGDTGWITHIHPRRNYIIRKATKLSKQVQVIAANLDLALVIATPVQPRTSTGFIDRFLATAEAYAVPGGVLFNKEDLYGAPAAAWVAALRALYESIGYLSFTLSALRGTGLDRLRSVLKDRVTLLAGHSGTGKSTLINALVPGLALRTTAISEAHLKGMHTTTFAEMHRLPSGGFLIDTPGIREFGLVDINPAEVSHYFPEIFALAKQCRYYNCTHTHEADCEVIRGVTDGRIAASRYDSYLSIYRNEDVFR